MWKMCKKEKEGTGKPKKQRKELLCVGTCQLDPGKYDKIYIDRSRFLCEMRQKKTRKNIAEKISFL
jgi:hypothetical protein